jgi:hypothetical protein
MANPATGAGSARRAAAPARPAGPGGHVRRGRGQGGADAPRVSGFAAGGRGAPPPADPVPRACGISCPGSISIRRGPTVRRVCASGGSEKFTAPRRLDRRGTQLYSGARLGDDRVRLQRSDADVASHLYDCAGVSHPVWSGDRCDHEFVGSMGRDAGQVDARNDAAKTEGVHKNEPPSVRVLCTAPSPVRRHRRVAQHHCGPPARRVRYALAGQAGSTHGRSQGSAVGAASSTVLGFREGVQAQPQVRRSAALRTAGGGSPRECSAVAEGAGWTRQQSGVEITKLPYGLEGGVTGSRELGNAASATEVVAYMDATHE